MHKEREKPASGHGPRTPDVVRKVNDLILEGLDEGCRDPDARRTTLAPDAGGPASGPPADVP